MKRNRMSKLSASLIVLVMAMSALILLPPESGGQPASTSNIYVPVLSGGFPVTDAWVNLTNVHTGAVVAAQYTPSKSAYVVANAPSGYYRVDVVHPDYYDQLGAAEFRFDGFTNYTTSLIQLTGFAMEYTWNITVRNPLNQLVGSGTVVGFYDPVNKEFVARGTTNSASYVELSMFSVPVVGDVYLVVMKAGYQTYIEPVSVTASNTTTIKLADHVLVSSYITDANGPATNVVSYLINTDSSIPWVKRVLKSSGSAMAFDAYDGSFILVVDADGDAADVRSVTVSGSPVSLSISLGSQTKRTDQSTVTYGANYNSFGLAVDTTWSYDQAYPGLRMTDMGSLRMQVDLLLGNGDGTLSAGEVSAFYSKVEGYGTQHVSSSSLFTVNDTIYESALTITGYTMDLAAGSVISTTGVHYAYSCQYTSHTTIYVGATSYTANAWARYDSSQVDYQYSINLVSDYELVANSSTSLVTVSGYETVDINPTVGTGSGELVALTLEESLRPVAEAGVLDSAFAHAVYVDLNVSRYLVAINENVTLTASGSDDPNKNPLKYMWNFGDGTSWVNATNLTVVHMFTVAASFTANLTVIDSVGLENWSEIAVVCDDEVPSPVITVKDKTVVSNTIEVNQRELVWFNATSSTDSAVSAGDGLGVIDHVTFDWGYENLTNRIEWTSNSQNISFSWEKSGTFNVTLNATDVVGHWANTTMYVKVNDTEAPTVTYVVRNETWQSTYIENTTLYFDANGTIDNVDSLSDLNFSWNFADGTWFNGTGAEGAWNVTHVFNSTGDFNIALNVSDKTGNYKVERKLIPVLSGPRPNLWIERVYYDPLNFTEGKTGYILVNVTNKGSINATNVQISFYIVLSDGTQKAITTGTGTLWVNDTQVSVIEPGQQAQYKFPYTPGSKGTFIIRVNVTCDNQLRPYSFTASGDNAMPVNQAAWKQWALWGGVLAIIVLIPLLLMFRGRLAKREKKGPRRERKEKEREREKKESDEEL
jgi:hypothetical protein